MKFLLDTNVFIESYYSFYAQDFCPGFWDFLKNEFDAGKIGSINKVYQELIKQNDNLANWVKVSIGKTSFIDETVDDDVLDEYFNVTKFINEHSRYRAQAKREFLEASVADPWLCAYASVHSMTVVTREISAPESQKKIHLPDVLNYFNVKYINTFDFLRMEKALFVLK